MGEGIKIWQHSQMEYQMKLNEVFGANQRVLNIYISAGYPKLESLGTILPALEASGVDIIEIGIPYSDPIADGPTIQRSNSIALENGITVDTIFDQISACPVKTPLILMGYFNTVLQFGVEAFCKRCHDVGVSGVILPDLPLDLYLNRYVPIFKKYALHNICLITPETSEERIRQIDLHSSSFIYAVSSSSTTGKNKSVKDAADYLQRIQSMQLSSPLMVGFNIKTSDDFDFVCDYAAGGIIGSAFLLALEKSKDIKETTHQFIKAIRS